MSVSIVWYTLIVLSIFSICHVTKSSRSNDVVHNDDDDDDDDDVTPRRQFTKPKELLRHQQKHRPHFIDRRLTLDSRIQRYADISDEKDTYYDETSANSRYVETSRVLVTRDNVPVNSNDDVEINDESRGTSVGKRSNYEEAREIKVPETSIEKLTSQIRHGRSRGHYARSSKLDEPNDSARNSGTIVHGKIGKNRVRNSSDTRNVETNETIYVDLDFPETTIVNNSTEFVDSTNDSWIETDRSNDEKTSSKYNYLNNNKLINDNKDGDDDNRRFAQVKIDQSNFSGRVVTSKEIVDSPISISKSRLADSLEKLRKVVTNDRGHKKSLGRVKNNDEIENSTGNRSTSGKIGAFGYGTIVHDFRDDAINNDHAFTDDFTSNDDLNDRDRRFPEEGKRSGNLSFGKTLDYDETTDYRESSDYTIEQSSSRRPDRPQSVQVDIVTRFLRIIENQHFLGENCTAGTDLNLGEGVVDQYAQERFRLEANLAVNRANMLTRLWKYAPEVMLSSEYLLHASILSMVEFDEDIFAAGNCYDKLQYHDRWLYCPFAHRLQDQDGVLVKDLAVEYKYLSNSSEWFYIARKNAERVIASNSQFSHGYHSYTHNESTHTSRIEDEILTVRYEDGRWSKPYYDCGGGNIWMLTYTVPFFGYTNDTYFFKGTSGIDIDLRRVDIDQCPLRPGSTQLNIFAGSDKCKNRTTECVATPGLGFRRGSYRCVCKRGYYYPDVKSIERYYNGTVIEEEFEKLMLDEESQYSEDGVFECLPCAEGCEFCEDGSPCVVSLNWLMRTAILILECCIIACLPAVILFTWKYGNVKVVRAASPVLLRVIVLGAFFIYSTTIVMYPSPNVVTCTIRVWLREIGFSLTYGALMLKTWRISVIFRVKSAKAVKITDMNLLKRLGIIVTIFAVFLGIRTLVAPPVVIVARTADDLKAYLCRTDWWDHSFTTLEVMFLIWGIRLCIVVRKAPSEFNESRFISMAIYNEFLLSVFLNVSMLFLQSPANPDLLYIIFFCHTQLTVTLLLGLIFGSKAYVVFRGGGKEDAVGKLQGTTGKFIGKSCRTQCTSNQTNSISLQQGNFTEEVDGVTEEFRRLYAQLELLKEKNMRLGNRHLATKIQAMQEAAGRSETQVSTIQAISSSLRLASEQNNSVIVETEVSNLNDEKSSNVYQKRADEHDDTVTMARNKGGKKKSLETRGMKNGRGQSGKRSFDECENSDKEKSIVNPTFTEHTEPVKAMEENQVFTGRENDDTINHEMTTRESDAEGVVVVVSCPGNSLNNTSIVDNGEASSGHDVEIPSTTRKKDLTGGTLSATGGPGVVKERGKNKSGHARTHAIVINLDDKSRFSEEVTV